MGGKTFSLLGTTMVRIFPEVRFLGIGKKIPKKKHKTRARGGKEGQQTTPPPLFLPPLLLKKKIPTEEGEQWN